MAGGRQLSEGARRYLEAMQLGPGAESSRKQGLLRACGEYQRLKAGSELVRVIACVLLKVALYRLDEHEGARRVEMPLRRPSYGRLAATMAALDCVCAGLRYSGPWPDGFGLGEVSPVRADAELEAWLVNESADRKEGVE
jgi:hypothetical protein